MTCIYDTKPDFNKGPFFFQLVSIISVFAPCTV